MDVNDFRGLVTLVMLVAFIGVVRWAWHAARKPDFDRAAATPLRDEPGADAPARKPPDGARQ
jgi:cytochrome c oxidase cbb3-type subunit 4